MQQYREGFISGKRVEMSSTKRICPGKNTGPTIKGMKGAQQTEKLKQRDGGAGIPRLFT